MLKQQKLFTEKSLLLSIVVNGPDFRLEFDITYLNEDLAVAFGKKFTLSLIDVFSRKDMIYGVDDKKLKLYYL